MISVVIPAFNEEKLIADCLVSLNNQDFVGQYEIIVVDNASQDNTSRIARESGAKVVYCPKKGVTHARQFGAQAASGDIIVQADADTVYPSWWLTRIQKQFNSHPKAVAVAGTFVYKNPPWWAHFEYFLRIFFNMLSALILKRPYIISGANFAFYSSALGKIGGYDPHSYSSDQFNISTRLSKIGKIIYDRKSWGATSERSVVKPLGTIFVDFLRHLKRFAIYMYEVSSPTFKRRTKDAISTSPKKFLIVGIPVFLVGILCYGYYVPSSPVFGKVYYKSITADKVIALTFDDGPNEPYTSDLLNVLKDNDVKATFFLVGENVKLYPETARRIVADENVIGNHTYSHNANHALFFGTYRDVALAQKVIYSVTGVEPHLYRPPHGKKSPWELQAIKGLGLVEVVWNISTNELGGKSPAVMAQQIIDRAQPGGVILLHDGYGTLHGTGKADKSDTVAMVPIIIQGLKAQGYTFVTVPQLLELPAYYKVAE